MCGNRFWWKQNFLKLAFADTEFVETGVCRKNIILNLQPSTLIFITTYYLAKNHSSFRLLIEDRDEIESFQGYLKVFDPVGLQFLQLWLTLRGYEKEYHRRLAELDQPNRHITDFIKWNIKCAKALIDKYFRQTRNDSRPAQVQNFQYEVELHIQQTKATPSIDTIAQLQNSLKNLLSVLQTLLEVIQFKAFCEHNQSTTKEIAAIKQISKKASAKYLPRLPENEVCII